MTRKRSWELMCLYVCHFQTCGGAGIHSERRYDKRTLLRADVFVCLSFRRAEALERSERWHVLGNEFESWCGFMQTCGGVGAFWALTCAWERVWELMRFYADVRRRWNVLSVDTCLGTDICFNLQFSDVRRRWNTLVNTTMLWMMSSMPLLWALLHRWCIHTCILCAMNDVNLAMTLGAPAQARHICMYTYILCGC